jgi:CheY-like chemotaxis protein
MGPLIGFIDEAENGEIAVAKYKTRPCDVILMDLHMPVLDGYRAAQFIRVWQARTHKPRIPIIALTAADEHLVATTTRAAGFTACISKRVPASVLRRTIEMTTSCACALNGMVEQTTGFSSGVFKRFFGGGDAELARQRQRLHELRSTFLFEKQNEISQISAALEEFDLEAVALIAYRLKGEGTSFGFDKMSGFADALIRAADRTDVKTVRKLIQKMNNYLSKVMQ